MDDEPKAPNPAQLLRDLERNQALRHQAVAESGLDPHLALLRTWQSERLSRTYADFLKDKRYRPACLFFLSDIYAPRDFSQRNHDIERVHAFLSRVVPAPMLQLLTDTIELNQMSDSLDTQLVRVLVDELGVSDSITAEQYAEAYRRCDNYAERIQQLKLVNTIVTLVGEGAHLLVVRVALGMLRGPANKAGWTELYGFLERGYDAFKQMRNVGIFAGTIMQREKRVLDRIYANDPNPFAQE
ncbi:MAG: hypothetical protein U0694_26515 [Anaerolineae bacterium]